MKNMIENRKAMAGQGGFTLIELLVVIAILAVLAGAAIVGIGAMRTNAQKTACKSDRDTIETAAEAYSVDNTGAAGYTDAGVTIASLTGGAKPYLKKTSATDFGVAYSSGAGGFIATPTAGGKYKDVVTECTA